MMQAYLKKQEKYQISNLTFHQKELEKEEQSQSQQKEGNNKDQRGNKIETQIRKNQGNQELDL